MSTNRKRLTRMSSPSRTQASNNVVSGNTLLVCVTAISIVAIAAVVAIFLGSHGEDSSVTLARAGIITGFVGILFPQLLLLVRQDRTTQVIESVKDDTHNMLNGAGQEKLEAAFHNVMDARYGKPVTTSENPPAVLP